MDIRVVLNEAGISDTLVENLQQTSFRYNRIHMPLEGKAIYHGPKEDRDIHEGMAYLLINSHSPDFEMFHDYCHMYIDFHTVPPLIAQEMVEINLSEDSFSLYVLKAIQLLLQGKKSQDLRQTVVSGHDNDLYHQIKRLLQVMLAHWQVKYHVNALENPKIESAIRYIDMHYNLHINNEDIAAALYIDKRSLIRLFSKHMNISPGQYLTQRRIEHSVEKLRSGKSVAETAYLCGYQSETAFRTAFKRVMGCSPKAILD